MNKKVLSTNDSLGVLTTRCLWLINPLSTTHNLDCKTVNILISKKVWSSNERYWMRESKWWCMRIHAFSTSHQMRSSKNNCFVVYTQSDSLRVVMTVLKHCLKNVINCLALGICKEHISVTLCLAGLRYKSCC